MSKQETNDLMRELTRSPEGIVKTRKLRVMPNSKYSAGVQSIRNIDVKHDPTLGEYQITIDAKDSDQSVQYLPWKECSGIYIFLQKQPPVFLTDKLTGCYLAFDMEKQKISHLNFSDYSDDDKRKTLAAYGHCHVLCPEDYRGNTTVFGVLGGQWAFFYQAEGVSRGRLSMSAATNRYGTKSVVLQALH